MQQFRWALLLALLLCLLISCDTEHIVDPDAELLAGAAGTYRATAHDDRYWHGEFDVTLRYTGDMQLQFATASDLVPAFETEMLRSGNVFLPLTPLNDLEFTVEVHSNPPVFSLMRTGSTWICTGERIN